MRLRYFYIVITAVLSGIYGCSFKSTKKQPTDWGNNYDKLAKAPYSLYLTYNSLPLLFPNAVMEKLDASYRLNNLGYTLRKNKGTSLLLMIGPVINFNEGEIDSIFSFITAGNQVLLSAMSFDENLLRKLNIRRSSSSLTGDNKIQKIFLKDRNSQWVPYPYQYKDHPIHGHFQNSGNQANYFYTLGTNENQEPDCIVYSLGKGKLFLHAAPVAFTNYFLLQGNNKTYLNSLFSYLPESISNVYLVSFNAREISTSDFSVLWDNIGMRVALLLTLVTLGIYLLFETKRRQKIIPIIKPVENSSVAFTETIGRLYYNKKNHANLAEKMVQHFLEYVRSNYYLNTSNLDMEFVRLLAAKSGKGIPVTHSLIENIKEVQSGIKADEAFLYSLYTQIQQFYNGKL